MADLILAADGKAHIAVALKSLVAPDVVYGTDGSIRLAGAARATGVKLRPVSISVDQGVIVGVCDGQNISKHDYRLGELV